MSENRNLFLAIALSFAILFGWQYFVASKFIKPLPVAETTATQVPAVQGASQATMANGAAPTLAGPVGLVPREAAISAAPRVAIEAPTLNGSINLKGGQIDDLALNEYLETVDPKSPPVKLLSPAGVKDAYYAEFGFTSAAGSALDVPSSQTVWKAAPGAKLTPATPVTLTYDNGKGLIFTRTISLDSYYLFTIEDKVANSGTRAVTIFPYGIVHRIGTPAIVGNYLVHEGTIGVVGSGSLAQYTYQNMRDKPEVAGDVTKAGWLGFTDKYFATALVPRDGEFKPRFLSAKVGNDETYQVDYLGKEVTVAPGATGSTATAFFAGPKEVKLVKAYEGAADHNIPQFNLLIDWGWFYFLTQPMFYLIDILYGLIGNFGLAILAVTVIIKAIMFPLANKSYASMSKMKLVQPAMADIKEKFADDKARQQQEIMELYKREKINPLAGCLPVLVQIPVFFSLYKVLYITIEMRHAPFYGWIHDLSAPDTTNLFTLFGAIPFDLSGGLLHLGIWPMIMGVTMWLQMRLNPTPTDPAQAMVFNWMPLIFMFTLGSFPAGLVIYWAWNNSLSILQQIIIMKRHGVKVELFDNVRSTFKGKGKQE